MKKILATVTSVQDLYKNFIAGGEEGWFSFVRSLQQFYEWKDEQWKEVVFTDTVVVTSWLQVFESGEYNVTNNATDTPTGLAGTLRMIVFTDYVGKQVKVVQSGTNAWYLVGGAITLLWATSPIPFEGGEQEKNCHHVHPQERNGTPEFKYLHEPVEVIDDLYLNFPLGGVLGDFSFVRTEKTFAYWDVDLEIWALLAGGIGSSATEAVINVGTVQGGYKVDDVIPVGTPLESIIRKLLGTVVINPTYAIPTLSISHGLSALLEVGTTLVETITPAWLLKQASEIVATSTLPYKLYKNTFVTPIYQGARGVHTIPTTDPVTKIGNETITYRATCNYGAAPTIVDNTETPNSTGAFGAGMITSADIIVSGVYPLFATTSAIATLTKQTLLLMNSPYFGVNVVTEAGSSSNSKQRVEIPSAWSAITGIQFYNTINNSWEYIAGSKANSLLTFTKSAAVSKEYSTGLSTDYVTFTHNGVTIGARQLRFYTT